MPISNRGIIRNAASAGALTTAGVSSGLLSPEQSRQFMRQAMEATPLTQLVRHEMRRARSGEIDKIGIAGRILRGKTENTDDGYRAKPNFSQVDYKTVSVRLPWEITEETLRENIEGQGLEATITNLMTRQVGIDQEDLCLNGNESVGEIPEFSATTAYAKGDEVLHDGKLYKFSAAHAAGAWTGTDADEIGTQGDVDFLKLNDGWVKQISASGHVVDHAGASMSLDVFYKALRSLPNKYNNGRLRWIMSPHRQQEWEKYILDKAITVGGIISDRRVENPCSIPAVAAPAMPDDKLLLVDPKNLVVVNTYDMRIRKTTEGKEAVMQDKRFYVIHFDFDAIVEELDAAAIVTNLNALV